MDVIEAITRLMNGTGCEVRVETIRERPFDVKANVLDSTKLQKDTAWKPQVDFSEGLVRTHAWLRNCHV